MPFVDIRRAVEATGTGRTAVALATCLAAALFVSAQLACLAAGIDLGQLTRDPAALAHVPFYTGTLSNLGLAGWGAAVALALLGWRTFRTGDAERRALAAALRDFALLTACLAADDLIQVHEYVAPLILGVRERTVYAAYVVIAAAWALRHRRAILERAPLPLFAAFCGLGGSVFADVFGERFVELPMIVEDGLKFIGIVNWALWAGVLVSAELASRKALVSFASPANEAGQPPAPAVQVVTATSRDGR